MSRLMCAVVPTREPGKGRVEIGGEDDRDEQSNHDACEEINQLANPPAPAFAENGAGVHGGGATQ
ncbi:hypothetical protein [Frankia sp. Cas4]|uniref:hypothetical protein n=1 Tax=Frankia sp. Cas4 TaxID=3073927 RepID=UPI002AD1FFAF|nr:hypothetical protein [Frankia sp. Cas4]